MSVLLASASAGTPVGYYASANGATSATLRSSLNDIVTSNALVVNFSNSTTSFAALDSMDEDLVDVTKVRMIYSGDTRAKHAVAGSSQDGNPATGGWNREHAFPQSFFDMDTSGDGDNPMVSDLHALFPCDSDINTQRSNKTFNTVTTATYTDIFGDRSNSTDFEPGSIGTNISKGRAARAVLYMDVRYEGENSEPNLLVTDTGTVGTSQARMKYLTTLLQWHRQYPPDAFERTRNSRTYNFQKNANPFVDHPEWVAQVYNDTAWLVENGTTLTVSASSVAPASATAATQNIPMLSLDLGVAGKEWHIGQMSFTQTGTSNDLETSDVKVWHDLDHNGTVEATDTLLGTGSFSAGNSTVVFADPFYLARGTMNLLVTATPKAASPGGKTLQLRLNANGITHHSSGGVDVNPTFSAISSTPVTITGVGGGVKIVAVSTRSSANSASAEFIVLANHTSSPITMTNWIIRRRSGTGSSNSDMTFSGTLAANAHFLIASSTYGAGANAVEGTTADYVDTNGSGITGGLSDTTAVTIALLNTGAAGQFDAVSYNGGSTGVPTLHEGTAFTGSLSAGQTQMLYRIRAADPGPYTDTDNNATDLSVVAKYGQAGAPRPTPPNSSVAVQGPTTAVTDWMHY
ncbi:MAG: endonuclease [Candidatus Sumerlaeaceae bacterium]